MKEEVEARHERELEEMAAKCVALVDAAKASAGKGKKAKEKIEAAERQAEQMEYELQERHREELEEVQGWQEGSDRDNQVATSKPEEESKPAVAADAEDEAQRAQRKKEKGAKKRQNRASKEAEREAAREQERLEAGPSAREVELEAIERRLKACKPPLQVLEVAADGNCLYRSVADQLRRLRPELHEWTLPANRAHEEVRSICASSLREREETYSPFAELKDNEDFAGYCDRVEHSCDWGGHLELRALADALQAPIHVYRAEEDALVLGGESNDGGAPLKVAYHRHYYALGEHYNSVIPR